MNSVHKFSIPIRTLFGIQFKKMLSNIAKPLEGKVAIVTASTDGIGFAAAKQLVSDGASIMICSRKINNVKNALEQLQKEFGVNKVKGLVCHVSKNDDRTNLIQETIKIFGGIDILVSNAATNPTSGPVLDCDEEVWDKIFDVNVKSAFLLTKEVAPHLISRGGGSIVYVSSIVGVNPMPMLGAYSVSKTALLGLTKVVAMDLAENNIRVNCIAPGIVKTKFASALTENESLSDHLLQAIPIKRFGRPEEIGSIISFLCSPASSFITGEVIVASGGMTSRL
ncbi:dehydrogenase/reductase SDR family member 4 isoform X1 [Rhopalosiphum maidis]|uniref:dehydrogenase/reductase SDR family member 4 isoform X1 n=2 Tax=Rhopalosiphum maidis TaxID=43146 RepID=UPI000EFDFC37|nr:dehydrogenase/reductase SDR family member 4 isoform X1 [Rhopalosiphum maidis]